jgi:biopolymer transport protein ExbB
MPFDNLSVPTAPRSAGPAVVRPAGPAIGIVAFVALGLATIGWLAPAATGASNAGTANSVTSNAVTSNAGTSNSADSIGGGLDASLAAGSGLLVAGAWEQDLDAGVVAGGEPESGSEGDKRSLLEMMFTGNPFGVAIVILILVLSVVSSVLVVENAISLRRRRLLPPDVMQALESALALRDTRAAMMICNDIDNHSMATQVVLAGLERFRSSEFGFAEYRSAVEEAGEHITGRLYRKVEILNVIASIAPMLGLTGTVIGMIDAFNTIAAKQGVAGPEDLAGGIGQALITTLLGLLVAIPTMVAFSFFRTRIDALVSEAGTRIERMMLPLGRRKSS